MVTIVLYFLGIIALAGYFAQIDVVTAGHCWHWFHGEKVLEEVRRVLGKRGKLVIVHSDWLTQVARGGYTDIETFTFDHYITYNQEQWRGRIRASAGVGASLSHEKILEFDQQQCIPKTVKS